MPKKDEGFRAIHVFNTTDRLLHKAAADYLAPVVDGFLSHSSYAYRKGLNRKGAANALKKALSEGFTQGIKADVSAFFDSVNIERLCLLLEGLFPLEPLIQRLVQWLQGFGQAGIKGLPQGSPFSPLLSNLYLDQFDKDMEKEGIRLIRFADDFVVLFKEELSKKEA